MAQGLTLLHSEHVEASRAFLALWNAQIPVPGPVVDGPEACVANAPAFGGYPSVVYEDATGARHTLFNPKDIKAVDTWKAEIDAPPKPVTTLTAYAFTNRFTDQEAIAIEVAAETDPVIRVAERKLGLVQNMIVDLVDPGVISYIAYLTDKGLLTQERAEAILTP